MITIDAFHEDDAQTVGRLIADTYGEYNLSFATPEQKALLLGPFQHAYSPEKEHQEAIARVIRSEMVFVARDGGAIVGVLRGRRERLGSLFVSGDHHHRGIGRGLVEHFERECLKRGYTLIRVASSEFAVPFYLAMGYKRSTGLRSGWSFQGRGLRVQPMRKVLRSG